MAARAEPTTEPNLDREWWLRTLLVLAAPRAVFAALRDDSEAAAAARSEPMAGVVFLAGISVFLSTTTASHLFDDYAYDALVIVVEAIVAGMLVGLQNYWVGGGALHIASRWLGSTRTYRNARHVVGFSMTPLVLSLVFVWPVALAVYGGDLFRTGGADHGTGRWVLEGFWAAAVAWSIALLLIGIRTVHGWSWPRSLAALAATAVVVGVVGLAAAVL